MNRLLGELEIARKAHVNAIQDFLRLVGVPNTILNLEHVRRGRARRVSSNSSSTRQHENTTMASAENVQHAHTIVQVSPVHVCLRFHSVSEKVGLGR